MRKVLLILLSNSAVFLLCQPAAAMEFEAPDAPKEAYGYMPPEEETFGQGLWKIFTDGINAVLPMLGEAAVQCAGFVGIAVLLSFSKSLSSQSEGVVNLAGIALIAGILLQSSNTMIHLAVDTVKEITDYGNLLLPVMTGAMAAQGRSVTAASLYTATAAFSTVLSNIISNLLAPILYVYILLSVVQCATGDKTVEKAAKFIKWICTWGLKISLYVFTGYMSITGAVTGSTDAAKLKAAKLTISGMVPVVGGILSDASESILVSAGIMKNAAGVYGLFVFASLLIEPFLRIGFQYLLLKATAAICESFDIKQVSDLLKGFSTTMGLLLAMTGSVCLMLTISVVCFMKGVS